MAHSDFSLLLLFLGLALFEFSHPWRRLRTRTRRWRTNLSLLVTDIVTVNLFAAALIYRLALLADEKQFGLFIAFAEPVRWGLSLVFMDFAVYFVHRLFHVIPVFWRFHRVHHSDEELDISTGLRFHPLEVFFSIALRGGFVFLLGVPPESVLVFEALLIGFSLYTHANIRIPQKIDSWIQTLFVTPRMHTIHHSNLMEETHSNFGNALSVWDRLFKTYRRSFRGKIGTPQGPVPGRTWWEALKQPFLKL